MTSILGFDLISLYETDRLHVTVKIDIIELIQVWPEARARRTTAAAE